MTRRNSVAGTAPRSRRTIRTMTRGSVADMAGNSMGETKVMEVSVLEVAMTIRRANGGIPRRFPGHLRSGS